MRQNQRRAFSLVEITLALGIAGFALLAIFGLLPIAQQIGRKASEETAAPKIFEAAAADLRATPAAASASPLFGISVPANSGSGSAVAFFSSEGQYSAAITPTSRYRLTMTFSSNPAGAAAATFATLKLTWPAAAAPANAAGSAECFVGFLRN
jgi:type II secretory pathway pseudopilin PulG